MLKKTCQILMKYLDHAFVRKIMVSLYEEILYLKFELLSEIYYIIDTSDFDSEKKINLKNEIKTWILNQKYSFNFSERVDKYLLGLKLVKKNISDYDQIKINDINRIFHYQYISIIEEKKIEKNKKEDLKICQRCGSHINCTCTSQISYSDRKNYNRYIPINNNTYYENKKEMDFIKFLITELDINIQLIGEIMTIWSSFKNMKKINTDEHKINKLRNKYFYIIYIIKLITEVSFKDIQFIIIKSPIYYEINDRISPYLFDKNKNYKLYKGIEFSFDLFFNKYLEYSKYKIRHNEYKILKYKLNLSFFIDSDLRNKIYSIINKMEKHDIDLIYNLCKIKNIKITKKDLEKAFIKYY